MSRLLCFSLLLAKTATSVRLSPKILSRRWGAFLAVLRQGKCSARCISWSALRPTRRLFSAFARSILHALSSQSFSHAVLIEFHRMPSFLHVLELHSINTSTRHNVESTVHSHSLRAPLTGLKNKQHHESRNGVQTGCVRRIRAGRPCVAS